MIRKMIEIDEEKCDGCGQCIIACEESALELVNDKATLVADFYCDGLGACLGECPQGALTIVEREADAFDEKAVEEKIASEQAKAAPAQACGCPSTSAMSIQTAQAGGGCPSAAVTSIQGAEAGGAKGQPSSLGHFPVKLQLLGPGAPFLMGADLVLLADCVATCYPDLHSDLLPGKAVAMGCPKLDDLEAHINRLSEIIKHSALKSLTVAHMEVPCCSGFVYAAEQALKRSGKALPLHRLEISRDGKVLAREEMAAA
jgi:ferredoxin